MNDFYFFSQLKRVGILVCIALISISSVAQQSVARQWSEVQLNCIRKDFARPTVQAHRLAHAAIVMWDAFAVYDDNSEPFLLGNTWGSYTAPFNGVPIPDDVQAAQNEALSYAMYRFLMTRYATAPAANLALIQGYINTQMNSLGYSTSITSTDYSDGDPAKLGNYIAAQMQAYALQDGSNMGANYANQYYAPVHLPLQPYLPGNPNCLDPNRWQSLVLLLCIDQNGNPEPCPVGAGAPALTPEFGNVNPFAMTEADKTVKTRDGHDWNIYHDPGPPPMCDTTVQTGLEDPFKWGFVMNIIWHSFHTADENVIDISPNSIGNVLSYPTSIDQYPDFYDMFNGGDTGEGYDINPATGMPYAEQFVPRGDYTRVLSEYWADGPASETPPGHWIKIFNQVSDNPLLEKKWEGEGEVLSNLEWDVRGYLAVGGGLLDVAIACWGAKGYYDSSRPIMAIREMCDRGQSTDSNLPSYHPAGIPLVPNYIELVEMGDPLAGDFNENVGKIKLYTWKGPEAATGDNGVGWMLGENWWTYQRSTFVTPPFPGFYSGHSTYSRASAEIMTLLTGDEYFPGGMGEFVAPANAYLLAETGPSTEVRLQWAKYRDASDQCSLSRIYGGLHPPQDDIPGRMVGSIVGPEAFNKASEYMTGALKISSIAISDNLISDQNLDGTVSVTVTFTQDMDQTIIPVVTFYYDDPTENTLVGMGEWTSPTVFTITYSVEDFGETLNNIRWHISGAQDLQNNVVQPAYSEIVMVDTRNPEVESFSINQNVFTSNSVGVEQMIIEISFDEAMDMTSAPVISLSAAGLVNAFSIDPFSEWVDNMNYSLVLNLIDNNDEFDLVDITIIEARDAAGNNQVEATQNDAFSIDTKEPSALTTINDMVLNQADAVAGAVTIDLLFSEPMNTLFAPTVVFPNDDVTAAGLTLTSVSWTNNTTYSLEYALADLDMQLYDIDVEVQGGVDEFGNLQGEIISMEALTIDTKEPTVVSAIASSMSIADGTTGAGAWTITIQFDEDMDQMITPEITFLSEDPSTTLVLNSALSGWENASTYIAVYDVMDMGIELEDIDFAIAGGTDMAQNNLIGSSESNAFDIDTRNPELLLFSANDYLITDGNSGASTFQLFLVFDEEMDTESNPLITFPAENPLSVIEFNLATSEWLSGTTYVAKYNVVNNVDVTLLNIDVQVAGLNDLAGNDQLVELYPDFFDIEVGVGVTELGDIRVIAYPNPVTAGNDIVVAMQQIPADLTLQLFNTKGQLIDVQTKANQNGNQLLIDTHNLASGLYMLQMITSSSNATLQVQVNK